MGELILARDKRFLLVRKKSEDKYQIRFDLQQKQLQALDKDGDWIDAKHRYAYFKGYSVNDFESEEEKFLKMVKLAREHNPSCKSISTFLSRLSSVLVVEHYEQERLEYEKHWEYDGMYGQPSRLRTIERYLHEYDGNVVNLMKKYKLMFTIKFEAHYFRNKQLLTAVMQEIEASELEDETKEKFFHMLTSQRDTRHRDNNGAEVFIELVRDHKYEPKALIRFVYGYLQPFENLAPYRAFELLRDYYRMASIIGRNVKRYPKYLRSIHDIIQANFNASKQTYDELLFKQTIRKDLAYQPKNGKFTIVHPESTKDIISEGTCLNHCVSSYVERIIKKQTYIFFLRHRGNDQESLVTLELKDGEIVQAKGAYNRGLEKDEMEFLESYCKKMMLKIRVGSV